MIPKQNPGDYVFSLDDNLYPSQVTNVKGCWYFGSTPVALIFEGWAWRIFARIDAAHGDLAKGIGSPVSHGKRL